MAAKIFDEVIQALDQAGASMRCRDLCRHLESLGFEIRDGKRGGHKVFIHSGIPTFSSSSFNCDHGRNPELKRPYINQVAKLLRKYEQELRAFLED